MGLAVAMLSSSLLIAPDKAEALSYQERMAAMEQRRQQLEATKAEACAPPTCSAAFPAAGCSGPFGPLHRHSRALEAIGSGLYP